jgi:hypothetical protein
VVRLDGPITDWGFISQLQLTFRSNQLTVETVSPSMPNETATKTLPLLDFLVMEMDRRVGAFVRQYIFVPETDATYVVSLDESPDQWLIAI